MMNCSPVSGAKRSSGFGVALIRPCPCAYRMKLESTVRPLGIEVDDALELSEQLEI